MKKLIIFCLLFIDIFILVIYFNLYKDYSNLNDELLNKLNGLEYEVFMHDMNIEKDKIINNIENDIGYQFNDNDGFVDIKNKLEEDYNELNLLNIDLNKKKKSLSSQKNTLQIAYNEILEEERKKNTYIIQGVPKINQYSLGYPTGCESAALTNLLNYWGVSVSMKNVVDSLAKGSLPYYENGIRYGGNPYLEFVGHPSTYSSYGVYEKPIIEVANKYKSGIINGTGMSFDNLLQIVREDRPVIVWVSMNMAVPYVSTSWIYKPTGEKIKWMANEHALVVIGYSQNQVIVSDSLNGGVRYYDKKVFESRYKTYGKRALYY